jgi:hypothetical protein
MGAVLESEELATSILKLASAFVSPLVARGGFYDEGSKFSLQVLDGERSLLEWKEIPSPRLRDPERLANTLEDLRLSLKAMGYEVGPPHSRRAS